MPVTSGNQLTNEISSIFGSGSHRSYISKNYVNNDTHITTETRYNFNKNIRKSTFKVDNVRIVAIKVRALNNAGQALEATCTTTCILFIH